MQRHAIVSVITTLGLGWSCPGQVVPTGPAMVGKASVIEIRGPRLDESGDPNPFFDYRLDVSFQPEDGEADPVVVPGYFAADGWASDTGATTGNLWRAHFVPEHPGRWTYRVSFRRGPGIAVASDLEAGEPVEGDGASGVIEVAPDPEAAGFLRLEEGRYLRFSLSKQAFLKGGADSPENFLAYADFDGTRTLRANPRDGEARSVALHRYEPHLKDWREGDPTWQGGKGKAIIGALNYLGSKGINSIYFVSMNLWGDGRDVWPYTSPEALDRFDVSKLDQWETVFSHAERVGILLHFVLTETENEALFEREDPAETDFSDRRRLYYREMIARFGHHRALVWNLGEENGWSEGTNRFGTANTDAQRKAFASYIRGLDPYDHPIVVHTLPGRYDEIYTPLLGFPDLDGPSLQMGDIKQTHAETLKWVHRSTEAGRPWFVCLDEIGPADTGAKPDADDPAHNLERRFGLWGNLMAGGSGVEWYFGYKFPHNDLTCEDFRSRDALWDQTRHALAFFQSYLPFAEMTPDDGLVQGIEGAHVLATPGEVYAVYLPSVESPPELPLPDGTFDVFWYNPRTGGSLVPGRPSKIKGGRTRLGPPPADPTLDWVALVRRATS